MADYGRHLSVAEEAIGIHREFKVALVVDGKPAEVILRYQNICENNIQKNFSIFF